MNGQVIKIAEENSSPYNITAAKGSSVWLHWNYTYIGDGRHAFAIITYREQIIRFNSTAQNTMQTLARRIGQNGALILKSPLPAQFSGRVEVISSNSTLVLHNLQYNDSTYRFYSDVIVKIRVFSNVPVLHRVHLMPIISLTVIGNFMAVQLFYYFFEYGILRTFTFLSTHMIVEERVWIRSLASFLLLKSEMDVQKSCFWSSYVGVRF